MDAKDTCGTQDTTKCVARRGIDSCVFFLQEGRKRETRKGRLYINGRGRGEWRPKIDANLEKRKVTPQPSQIYHKSNKK